MATATQTVLDQKLSRSPGKIGMAVFGIVLVIGVIYSASSLIKDLSTSYIGSYLPYLLLTVPTEFLVFAVGAGPRARFRVR